MLRVKFALGLFDHPYTPESAPAHHLDPAGLALARTAAERSLVLLKNGSGKPLLPVTPERKSIALIGPLADSAVDMLGSWPGKGESADVVTLKTALAERMQQNGGRLLYAKGTEIDTSDESGFAAALSAARGSDLILAALGESAAAMTGEAASRAYLELPGNQQKLLEQLVSTGKPVVLIVFSGRPLALKWAAAHAGAIVEAWYPGVQAGPALVRTLFGDTDFSGRLTVSIPRSVGQEPLYYNHLNVGRPAAQTDLTHPPANSEEKYISRYLDEQNAPLFPFGYGLSYTTFSYSPVRLSASSMSARALNTRSASVRASVTVTNTGGREAREVVQLYIGLRGTSVVLPVKELKGFRALSLAPGESRRVEFIVGRDELAFWSIEMQHAVEPAAVTIWIGPNSEEGHSAQLTITQ